MGVIIYDKRLFKFQKRITENQTEVEKIVWGHLRSKQFEGLKFRRQEQIGQYIVDFVCFKKKLIIELDGSQHIDDTLKDETRDKWLNSQEFTVLRFWNNEVLNNIEGVFITIQNYCEKHPPLTPPINGGVIK